MCKFNSSVCECRNSGNNSYTKSLCEMTPVFVYEMFSCIQNALLYTKWSLYEMTVNSG